LTQSRRDGSAVGRRGRPLHLPEDSSNLTGSTIRPESRIAWLLVTSRILADDPESARRETFISRLSERGIVVDAPRLSRWESGALHVPPRVLTAYEEVLGRTPGSLTAISSGLRRAFGTPLSGRERRGSDAVPDAEFDELLGVVSGGSATGAQWLATSTALQYYDHVFLRNDDWNRICTGLIQELATATGIGYVRRFEAAVDLLNHPSAKRHVSMALGNFVMDPDTQIVAPVLNLLAEVSDQAASDLVLRLLNSPAKHLHRAASSVAAAKIARGHFEGRALPALEEHVERRLSRGVSFDGGLDPLDLAVELPEPSWANVEGRLRDPGVQALVARARSTRELVAPRKAALLASRVAVAVQQSTPSHHAVEADMMLHRLMREALVHTHKARRHHAALLLAASAYAPAVASHCHELTSHPDDFIAARAWTVLMRVRSTKAQSQALRSSVLDTRDAHRPRALINVGLNHVPPTPTQARTMSDGLTRARPSEQHATLFALGMHDSAELAALTDHRDDDVRRRAAWWLLQGGATRDRDVVDTE
jgi:hypothetical protein